MNICVTVNSEYMKYTHIMLQSLYENNERGSIDLYVLQKDFTKEDKKAIQDITEQFGNKVFFIWMDPHIIKDLPLKLVEAEGSVVSVEIFFRLLIPDVLPMLDRVLLLDVDLIINKSIKELYDINMEGFCLAAAPNMVFRKRIPDHLRDWYPKNRSNWTHFNTGVLLWNLKYIRENYPKEYILRQAQKIEVKWAAYEEEIFNVLFGENKIKELDSVKWNYITTFENILDGKFRFDLKETKEELRENHNIIHYVVRKPWRTGFKNISFYIWEDYAKKTPYYQDIYREMTKSTASDWKFDPGVLLYKGMVLEKLLRIKGTGGLKKILEKRGISHICLFGAGLMAELFYLTLCADQIHDIVERIYDNNKQGKFHEFDICSLVYDASCKLRELCKDTAVIITPTYETQKIKKELAQAAPNDVKLLTLGELLE